MHATRIPLDNEIKDALKQLEIQLDHAHLNAKINDHPTCAALRRHLLAQEGQPTQVTGATFWELSPKYRFDVLAWDISVVAQSIVLSIGAARVYQPHLSSLTSPPYVPTVADVQYWYNIEFGFRLVSSGWDRLALLLDLLLGLKLEQYCSFPKAMMEIGKRPCASANAFNELTSFLHGDFRVLQGEKRGSGIRHEATHLMGPMTRHTMEVLESFVTGQPASVSNAADKLDLLVAQYHHYIEGVDLMLELIAACAPGAGTAPEPQG